MAQRLMITCDNPECKSIGLPEFVPGEDGPKRRGQKVMGPYGWHQGSTFRVGCGPAIEFMACSDACVGPAVIDLMRQAYEADR